MGLCLLPGDDSGSIGDALPCPAQVPKDKLTDHWDDGSDGNNATLQPLRTFRATFGPLSAPQRALLSLFYKDAPQPPGNRLMSMSYQRGALILQTPAFLKPSQDLSAHITNTECPARSTHCVLGAVLGFFYLILNMTT